MRGQGTMTRRDFGRAAAMTAAVLGGGGLAAGTAGSGMKLGLYSITYLGIWYRGEALTPEQVVQRAKRFGYEGVEIDGKRPHGNPLDMPARRCRDLRKYANDQGIEVFGFKPAGRSGEPRVHKIEDKLDVKKARPKHR